ISGISMLLFLAVLILIFHNQFFSDEKLSSVSTRFYQWMSGLRVILEYPIFGTGLENVFFNISKYSSTSYLNIFGESPVFYSNDIHNTIIQYFIVSGIPGGIINIFFWLIIFIKAYKYRNHRHMYLFLPLLGAYFVNLQFFLEFKVHNFLFFSTLALMPQNEKGFLKKISGKLNILNLSYFSFSVKNMKHRIFTYSVILIFSFLFNIHFFSYIFFTAGEKIESKGVKTFLIRTASILNPSFIELKLQIYNSLYGNDGDIFLKKLLELSEKFSASLYLNNKISYLFLKIDEPEKALVFINKVLSVNPNNYNALCNKSKYNFSINKKSEALKLCFEAFTIKPDYNYAYDLFFEIADSDPGRVIISSELLTVTAEKYYAYKKFSSSAFEKLFSIYYTTGNYNDLLRLVIDKPGYLRNIPGRNKIIQKAADKTDFPIDILLIFLYHGFDEAELQNPDYSKYSKGTVKKSLEDLLSSVKISDLYKGLELYGLWTEFTAAPDREKLEYIKDFLFSNSALSVHFMAKIASGNKF
ncbi:MAG: O-antigen ligase family protein, partial [Actinomycetia bacterium]|nr:O-antigen ligase family protein [Actinomycetes bacterium]